MIKGKSSYRWRNKVNGFVCLILALAMLVQYIPVSFLRDVFATSSQARPISVSFLNSGSSNLKPAGAGNYLLSTGEEMALDTKLQPNWNSNEGYAKGAKVTLKLPWFYYSDTGIILQTFDRNKVIEQNPDVEFIGGIEAKLNTTNASWYVAQPTDLNNWGSDYDGTTGAYRRQQLDITAGTTVELKATTTFQITFKFFTIDEHVIPENTSSSIALGSSYSQFYDANTNKPSPTGYIVEPGSLPSGGENPDDLRTINIINSNLNWETKLSTVSTPILWDKYNYAVYKVNIKNTSDDANSKIDYFHFMLQVPNSVNSGGRGVLEQDMMAWKWDSSSGGLVPNTDISDDARDFSFGGKYGKGGALIWDMTGRDVSDWSIDDQGAKEASEYNYIYSMPGEIGVKIDKDNGELTKDEEKIYYVAVPYVNNFGSDYNHTVKLKQTIYFGGRDLAWSKDDSTSAEFKRQSISFEHKKYVEENDKKVSKKNGHLGQNETYYLDSFKNTSNTPVFNSYAIDTLPEHFELNGLKIEMNNSSSKLSDWFNHTTPATDSTPASSDPLKFVTLKFIDKQGNEHYISLEELGASVTQSTNDDKNIWEISNLDQKIKSYLEKYIDYEFSRDIKFIFNDKIAVDEALNGRIGVIGKANYLLEYENTLNTFYERWNWTPYTTAETVPGYDKQLHQIKDPAKAIIDGERAKPLIDGLGVYHEKDDNGNITDLMNSSTNSNGEKYQSVSLADPDTAVRFELGTGNESMMIPSFFEVDGLVKKNNKNAYVGLAASSLYLSPELLSSSKIKSIDLYSETGVKISLTLKQLEAYLNSENNSITIPQSAWQPSTGASIKHLVKVVLNFDEFNGSVPLNKGLNAYIEINGTPNATGIHRFDARFSTLYNEYPTVAALGNITEDISEATAILDVSRIEPTIEASANWNNQTSNDVNKPLIVPNKNSTLNPTIPAFYKFRVGNKSESSALNVHLTLDLLSVKDVDQSTATVVKGFNTEKIVIKNGYDKAMKIKEIQFFDYDDVLTGDPTFKISQDDLTDYIDDHGNIVIEAGAFSKDMTRLKTIRIINEKFEKLITGDDCVEIGVYGDTDSYNVYNENNKLEANLLFEPIGPLYNDDDKKDSSAAFGVEEAKLSVSNQINQLDVQSTPVTSNTNTDKDKMTLGVPYARDYTYRVEFWNKSISVLDDTSTLIDLPTVGNDGGFHATSIVVYDDLLKQYGTLESITFIKEKSFLVSLFNLSEDIVMHYNPDTHTLSSEEKTYERDEQGRFIIPIDDVAKDDQLESIDIQGQAFVINDGQEIKPYIEINGWSDAPINTSNIIDSTSKHYLDGFRESANSAYTFEYIESADAYISKLYYDTTIVAGYNDNQPDVKFSKTSTPREHVRKRYRGNYYVGWNDNSELEVGYKGLGSYAVDFRQYLNTGTNLPGDDGITSQEHQKMDYIKSTSFNTAATVEMEVNLPKDYFDAYYLKINEKAKDYIESIQVVRGDDSSYTLNGDQIRENFKAAEAGYGRINLLQNGDSFNDEQFFKEEEENFYKGPETTYEAKNPIKRAVITLKINQEETKTLENGETVANNPDYGTWWNDSDESTKYMFEFSGRFYKVGVASASVSSAVTIGNDDKHNSIERQTSGSSGDADGDSWSFKNYYVHTNYLGTGRTTERYKADDLYSNADIIVVRDFNRITKGATTDNQRDYNREAKIGDDNQYYINYYRDSRTKKYGFLRYNNQYEAGVSTSGWENQDPDDWQTKVGYTDHMSIDDTLGIIEPDEIYEYRGTLTTGLDFHKQIVNYMQDDAVEIVLGTGKTQAEQKNHKQTMMIKKSDLVKNGDYYTLKFDNTADQLSDEEARTSAEISNGTLYLAKHQYILSFRALLWDIQGNGEYTSEIGNQYYNYKDADGNVQEGIDSFSEANDIVVRVKPFIVYEDNSVKIAQATNTVTTKTYHDYDLNTGHISYMFNDKSNQNVIDDKAYIMGYRIPFKAGHNLIAMGQTPIDSQEPVTADGNQQITDYVRSDGDTYDMLGGKEHDVTQNITPTNAQFGVKLYNQTVENPTERTIPARIRKVVTDDAFHQYYRLRNLYLPTQWIYQNGDIVNPTDKGHWFKMTQIQMRVNGKDLVLKPSPDGQSIEVTGLNLVVTTIPLDTIKKVNNQDCYVIDIEDYARQNYKALVTEQKNGLAQSYVSSLKMTLEATDPNFIDDTSVLSNGEYLTADKSDGYTYLYDGVYVDRPVKDFKEDLWTEDSVPTFGQEGNEYSPHKPYNTNDSLINGRRAVYNHVENNSVVFTSIDNNADTYSDVTGSTKQDSYYLRNTVGILMPELTKKRGTQGELFAYDKTEKSETADGSQTEVDLNHLMPYDYIEYTLSSKTHEQSELPLERNHLSMEVEAGQQIIGWQLLLSDEESENIIDQTTGQVITADDIEVTLSNDSQTLTNVAEKKDYSLNERQEDSRYRKIEIVVGSEDTQIKPGQLIKVRIITQLTNELKTETTTFEDQLLNTNAYIYAEPKHSYAQYAIEGYDPTYYVKGTMSDRGWDLNDTHPNPYVIRDDIHSSDKISYFRYQRNEDDNALPAKSRYNARIHNTLKYYDNQPLDIEYKFDRDDRMFEGQGAKLTVKKIKNDTMHFIDEQTVTVDFLDKNGYRGFTLTKMPTVSITANDGGDIYYPEEFVNKVGAVNMKPICVQYTLAGIDERADDAWKTVDYEQLPNQETMDQITALRWIYYDIYSGYEVAGKPYKNIIEFDDVVLVGKGRYEDIRLESATNEVMADTYLAVTTADIDHYQNHTETKDVMINDVEVNTQIERDILLNEATIEDKSVYREVPQVILHPQVFDSQSDAEANYNETASQKLGYRPEETYWQKVTLINREMKDLANVQNARQGTLINPTIYDKIPSDYVSIQDGTLQFKWLDVDGNPVAGDYRIEETIIEDSELYDYGGKMVYEKSDSVTNPPWKTINANGTRENGVKAFDDLIIDDAHTMKTQYTVKSYTVIDNTTGKPITMDVGDTLIVYYQLKVAKDNLPMVYVDEDKDLSSVDDQHPAYFPRAGEYYQIREDYTAGYRNGQAYPFSSDYTSDADHSRAIQNSDRMMDMDYLLHDIGITASLNTHVDKWEFLKDSYVYIPGDDTEDNMQNARYGGGNKVLGDYDISSLKNMQKTIYTPGTAEPNGAGKNWLPETDKTSMKNAKWDRDWYEIVMEPRITDEDNWGSETPIVWAQNRIHLQKAWLVSASEFINDDANKDNRQYEATTGDGLTDNRVSNPNYKILPNRSASSNSQKNQLHSYTDDNYEVGLEYNEKFTTKLQALNYGDWDLKQGIEFTYTMPRGIEPLIFDENGNVDISQFKAEILNAVNGADNEGVHETYRSLALNESNFTVDILQRPSDKTYTYLAPTEAQDPLFKTAQKADYPTGEETSPWVIKIIVKENLKKWFNRGSESGYKLNVSIPSHVYSTNDNEEWFDRLQTRPYVDNTAQTDHYYYQILDIDHWEGTTRENMQHNQRYGMDYMWYRGDGNSAAYYFGHSTYYYYNGSMNTPYINGYNIQNQEVSIDDDNGKKTGVPIENNYAYGLAEKLDRYSQTGTRAVMRKPLLRQWTTTGEDKTGKTLSDYYIEAEGGKTDFNIHVENKYYLDELGTNYTAYSGSYTDGTKEVHSYATDGGARGTYQLPVITNILPYGIAPVGTAGNEEDSNIGIFSTKASENTSRQLNWELLNIDGTVLSEDEKALYETEVDYIYVPRVDEAGNEVVKDGKVVTEGRYVVKIYARANSEAQDPALEAKIKSGEGRTFSFETFTYAAPKLETINGETLSGLGDAYENNYTYISSKMDNFKALIDEDISSNKYTVGSLPYNRYKYSYSNSYVITDNRHDAIVETITQDGSTVNYGKIPNQILKDKITGEDHYVIGQGMERVYENIRDKDGDFVYNLEDYRELTETQTASKTKIRDALVLKFERDEAGKVIVNQTDFNLNNESIHYDYQTSQQVIGDMAFVNTTKVRTMRPNLTLQNFVSSDEGEVGKQTPTRDENGKENVPGSTPYTYDHDNNTATAEETKDFDYGDEVWYTAQLTNKTSDSDYANQGSIYHSRLVFSYHLPDIVTAADEENWDQWRNDDFVIELKDTNGHVKQRVTPSTLAESGWAIRVINKGYQKQADGSESTKADHTGQIITFELITAADKEFVDYDSYVQGYKPAGYLGYGDTVSLKIRTRIDNKEAEGIDPSDQTQPDVWSGYYSEAYATIHSTNSEYIMTDQGHIYNDDERDQVKAEETIIYDGYTLNKDILNKYDKSFTLQPQTLVNWHDKKVSDEKNEDGTITNDYDQDGELDEAYAYASSASIQVLKPEASMRIDTSRLRKRVSDDNASIVVIDDAHVRSADEMDIRMTQAVNEQANVNQFIATLNIPHRGTNVATAQVAGMDAKEMISHLKEIRTGRWEVPETHPDKTIYDAHLKVYVYGLIVNDPWTMSGYVDPDYEDEQNQAVWTLLGNAKGYQLEANEVISENQIDEALNAYKASQTGADNVAIYQLKWVVTMEGLTTEDGKSYSEKEAAINYPVPIGLRMAIDSEGETDKEINVSDPKQNNTDADIMQHSGVTDNAAYVKVITGAKDVSDGIAKHVNYFAHTYAKYDDHKYATISTVNRAGFYIDPELPTLQINLEQGYFKPTMEEVDGTNKVHFGWDYNNSTIDDVSSTMLKYRVTMMNKKIDKEKDILIQDNATSPNMTVALPYNEKLDTSKLKYVKHDTQANENQAPKDYLNDYYETYDKNLDKETPLWTWYIVDEKGNYVENNGVKAVKVSDESPVVTSKELTANRKEKSKILNFYFSGELQPGENLKVEVMVPIQRMNSNAISSELLQCKAYIFKSGAFNAYTPDQGSTNSAAYEYDSQDVNENGYYNDTAITKTTSAISFTTIQSLGQTKLVDTELESNATNVPAAVNEGGNYTFKISSASLSSSANYKYKQNVLYDVLPYVDDHYVYQTRKEGDDYVKSPRQSKWNGWIDIDSFKVIKAEAGIAEQVVDEEQYKIWIGPMVKQDGKLVINNDQDGKPCIPDAVYINNETNLKNLVEQDTDKEKYFVQLEALKAYLETASSDEKQQLLEGIRAVWLQMDDEYTIQPSSRLELTYTMHAPQNVPKYLGTVATDSAEDKDSQAQIIEAVKDYTGWNTFLSRAYSQVNEKYEHQEETVAGVYVNAPTGRGYIGSYIWQDVDFNALKDEGTYTDQYNIGRDLLETPKYDLDNDGLPDDPGINGVQVELLSQNGRPVNKEGEAIGKESDFNGGQETGKYIILNDANGQPELLDAGTEKERFRYSTSRPATYVSESDYYGNKGYYVFSNLKPGKYNMRYTLPSEYADYSVTTKELNTAEMNKVGANIDTPVIVYRHGEVVYNASKDLNDTALSDAQKAAYQVKDDTLVVQTAISLEVTAVNEDVTTVDALGMTPHERYDRRSMGYNLGIGRTNLYKGTAWLDETYENSQDDLSDVSIDGIMQEPDGLSEKRLGKIKVEAYEIEPETQKPKSEPAITADGQKASYVTDEKAVGHLLAGEYEFRLVPGKTYVIKTTNLEKNLPLKPTAPIHSLDPTADTKFNDLLLENKVSTTKPFTVPYIIGEHVEGWKDYELTHTIDLGFVKSSRGFIGQIVWDDKNYNGIQDSDEKGLENVTVTLESYYYDSEADKWSKLPNEKTVKTNTGGAYQFTVSTYYDPDITDKGPYLMGYKVRIDQDKNNDLFNKYAPTWQKVADDGTQSDMPETPNSKGQYLLTPDYVLIAERPTEETLPEHIVNMNGQEYDIGNAATKNYDAGLIEYVTGDINGIVWLDHDYDGIRDEEEAVDSSQMTPEQQKLSEIEVKIKGYYYDNGVWKDAQMNQDKSVLALGSDRFYHYDFKDLPASLMVNGKAHLMGYKLSLDESSIDKILKPTLKYQGTGDLDSHLDKVSANEYNLNKADEYVIVAAEAKQHTQTKDDHDLVVSVDDKRYDMLQHQDINGYDAGLSSVEPGEIAGSVWIDYNYDGIKNDTLPSENGMNNDMLKGIQVDIKQYIVSETDGKKEYTENTDYTQTVKTDQDGHYSVKNLPAYFVDDQGVHHLYAYQVILDQKKNETFMKTDDYRLGITKYHQGEDAQIDSDWSNNGTLLHNEKDYLILLNKATEQTPSANELLGYDIVKGKAYSHINAGAAVYQQGAISGMLFDDLDYNGLYSSQQDKPYENVKVILKQYTVDENNHYKETGETQEAITNAEGEYLFKDLQTHGQLDNGDTVIYAYQISLSELPAGYAITKYHVKGESHYSNIDPKDNILKTKADKNAFIILAVKSEDKTAAQYFEGYDLIEADRIDSFDGGLTKFHPGSISGYIFDDQDYDGLFTLKDKGQSGVTVLLTQYAKIPGADEYTVTGAADFKETDENGYYQFNDLPTSGLNEENQRVLYAYRVTVNEETIPEGYATTRYRADEAERHSKLKSSSYELISDKENQFPDSREPFIIIAGKADSQDISYYQEGYDLIESIQVEELNGGISKVQTGEIKGQIFDDLEYDGLLNDQDMGKEGIKVVLKQFIKDPETEEYQETDFSLETVTDAEGNYQFHNLKTYETDKEGKVIIYYYSVYVDLESIPENYAITKYQMQSDKYNNSHLIAETGLLCETEEYIAFIKKTDDESVQSQYDGYDLIQSHNIDSLDGGITAYGKGKISGTIWLDTSQNGKIDMLDPRIVKQTVNLQRYYYKEGQWIEDLTMVRSAVSDQEGYYEFDQLDSYVIVEGEKYLAGYQAYIQEVPSNMQVIEPFKNKGVNDSKLLEAELRLSQPVHEKDGYMIMAREANTEADINSSVYTKEGYDIVKTNDIDDINAGYQQRASAAYNTADDNSAVITADDTTLMQYCLLAVSSFTAICVFLYKKRKAD